MSDVRHVLLSAIYGLLSGDDALQALIGDGGIYDQPGRDARYPLIAFSDLQSRPQDQDGDSLVRHRLSIEVYSRTTRQDASAIAQRVEALVDDAMLALPEHRLIALRHLDTSVAATRDRRAFRAQLSFQILTDRM